MYIVAAVLLIVLFVVLSTASTVRPCPGPDTNTSLTFTQVMREETSRTVMAALLIHDVCSPEARLLSIVLVLARRGVPRVSCGHGAGCQGYVRGADQLLAEAVCVRANRGAASSRRVPPVPHCPPTLPAVPLRIPPE